jgi:hypothetical protein
MGQFECIESPVVTSASHWTEKTQRKSRSYV